MSEENTDEIKKSNCGEGEGHECKKDENKGDECCGGGGGCCGK